MTKSVLLGMLLLLGFANFRAVRRVAAGGTALPRVRRLVEVEMGIDHDAHIGRAEIVLRQRVGGVAVDDLPLLDDVVGPPDPGVDEDRAGPRVLDHKAMHWDLVERIDASEM